MSKIHEILGLDVIVLDQDAEPVLKPGQQGRDRHRIEFGESAEHFGVVGESGHPGGAEAKHFDQQSAQRLLDFAAIVQRHDDSPTLQSPARP